MSRDRDPHTERELGLDALDGQPGPAPALTHEQLHDRAEGITARFVGRDRAPSSRRADESDVLQPLDDAPGPAPTLTHLQLHTEADTVTAKMAARRFGLERGGDSRRPGVSDDQAGAVVRRTSGRRPRRRVWQSAATAVLAALVAGAALAAMRMWFTPSGAPETPSRAEGTAAGATQRAPTKQAPAPADPKSEPRDSSSASPESADPAAPAEPHAQHESTSASPPESADRVGPAESQARQESSAADPRRQPTAPSDPRSPERLMRAANQARAQRRWRRAERLYMRVVHNHADRSESYAATVAAASLRLEHTGDPAGALRLYRHALSARPEGALAEEAHFGVARSLRALGRAEAERSALREFLERYPNSLLKRSVSQRLQKLR